MWYFFRLLNDCRWYPRQAACGLTLLALIGIAAGGALADGQEPPPDLVVVNARIWTGVAAQPWAANLAVRGDRIAWLTQTDGVRPSARRIIDASGRLIVPGFYDAHVHLLGAGLGLARVQLKDAADAAEFNRRLREFDAKLPRDRWLLGGRWDHDRTFGGQLPTAAMLDAVVPDRPVFLHRYDGHSAVANSAALRLAGITAATPDPPGGEIVRLADGKTPSGVLRNNAKALVERVIPPLSTEEISEAILAALAEARQVGVTSVEDLDGSPPEVRRQLFRLLQTLERQGKLTCRVSLRWPLTAHRELSQLGILFPFGSDYVRIGGLKGYADGSLGSSTARMFAPYLHEPQQRGIWVTPPGQLETLIEEADAAGLNICVHCIGDEANAVVLDFFHHAAARNGPRERRFRIEHAQILRREDYRRFAAGKVIASMQPYHISDDGRWAEGRIGRDRCAAGYAYRSLLDAGVVLALGSDWPVAPLNPLLGIDAAVHRRTLDGRHPDGWIPEQKITVAEALRGYTWGSAYAAGREHVQGTLAPGMLADFVMLDRNILDDAQLDHLAETQVLLTVVGGRVVFERAP
jgi:predicted amidohydrolase YtcJ